MRGLWPRSQHKPAGAISARPPPKTKLRRCIKTSPDWKRKKWNALAKKYIRLAEYLATKLPNAVVTDSKVIQEYYREKYQAETNFIAYGADVTPLPPGKYLQQFRLEPRRYFLYVGRLVPENCAHHLVQAMKGLNTDMKCVIIGDAPYAEKYIAELKASAASADQVIFTGYLFGEGYRELSSQAFAFIETSEVGGTHPALLEAMAFGNCVIVNDTPENLETIGEAGLRYRGASGAGHPFANLLGYRVAAIRELFEEAGVLLAYRKDQTPFLLSNDAERKRFFEYRKKLNAGELTMLELAVKEQLLLALDQLHYYTHWITPEANPVRFDTRFFAARHPSGQEASPDLKETTDGIWIAPRPALEANIQGTVPLSPPTLKTLEDVARFDALDSFISSLQGADKKPPVRPVSVTIAEETVLIYPWDPEYEKKTVGIPLFERKTPVGVIVVQTRESRVFTPAEISTLTTIAYQISSIVINAKLLDSIRKKEEERAFFELELKKIRAVEQDSAAKSRAVLKGKKGKQPLVLIGAAVSPGTSNCNFTKAPAFTVTSPLPVADPIALASRSSPPLTVVPPV